MTRRAVEKFRHESKLDNTSAALRVLIGLGLEKAEKLEPAWRNLALREAFILIQQRVGGRIEEMFAAVLKELS